MKILCDLHHQGLFYSLQLLFEKRLGWDLYRPIGLDWYTEGYWHIYPHIDTAKQYLDETQGTQELLDCHGNKLPDGCKKNIGAEYKEGIFYIPPGHTDRTQKAITLEKFKEIKFDILLSSIPEHIEPYNKLINLYQPQAKHIFQVGNAWGCLPGVKNILASTAVFPVPSGMNVCFYHQEFDLNVYSYIKPSKELYQNKKVNSYIHYMQRKDLMNQVASILQPKGFNFISYGAGMDHCFHANKDIAQAYKDSLFTWHYKPEGDGYGYGPHCSYACGRPLIVQKSFYKGKLADQLMIDNQTCLAIDHLTPGQIATKIASNSHPDRHKELCENSYKRFRQVVSFDNDFIRIKKFLENLK